MAHEMSWPEGMKLDWVPRSRESGAPGGQHGVSHGPHVKPITPDQQKKLILNPSQATSSFQKAQELGQGRRFRCTIDKKMSDGRYRVTLDDTLETAWVEGHELEPLDSVTALGDLVGPRGKSLEDALDAIPDEVHECVDCGQPIQGSVYWRGKEARDEACRNKKLGLT